MEGWGWGEEERNNNSRVFVFPHALIARLLACLNANNRKLFVQVCQS